MSTDLSEKYLRFAQGLENGSIPPGYTVKAYVRSTGLRAADSSTISALFYTSILTALAACTSETNQIIYVLPGHVEAVGTALFTSAPTGVTICGIGLPDTDGAPTLQWTATASNIAVAAKNTTIINLRMIAGANDITEAITVTAAGFKLLNCHVDGGVTSAADFISFLNFSTGANDGLVAGCTMRATVAANAAATYIKPGAAVDNLRIIGNRLFGLSSSTTIGPIHVAAAATNLLIAGNLVDAQTAASIGAITFTDVAATGFCCDNYTGSLANAVTITSQGVTTAGSTNILVHFQQNYCSDGLKATSGVVAPALTT